MGVRAGTIRAVARNLWLIDEEFRQNPRNHRLFLEILRAPRGVTHELRRMNDYGVLGRYIPAFGRVIGRMQYDLFHVYTVDAHTLFVVSNLRRMAMSEFDHELPLVSSVMQQLPKPEIAYLGALFHDVAKGRGGDHTDLGAVDAEAFCLEQGLSRYDARLVAWLVKNHLLLSMTSQKRDIGDPQVVSEFARKVGDEVHLDYLYVLTCADVRGTNPKLWNSWKASLFNEFYEPASSQALRRGLETPVDQDELVREVQESARAMLRGVGRLIGDDRSDLGTPAHRVLHAARTGGDRTSYARAGLRGCQCRRGAGLRGTAERARHDSRDDLCAAPSSWFRARHRRARSAGTQHSRCAHYARWQWIFARLLPCPRGGRLTDHRCRATHARSNRRCGVPCSARKRLRSPSRAARPGRCASSRHPPRSRSRRMNAIIARCWN